MIGESIPTVACVPFCSECCGPVPVSLAEHEQIGRHLAERGMAERPLGEGLRCGYLAGGRCTIYEVRPFLCRLYGATDALPCPRGCRPERRLGAGESEAVMGEYRRSLGRTGWRLLCSL